MQGQGQRTNYYKVFGMHRDDISGGLGPFTGYCKSAGVAAATSASGMGGVAADAERKRDAVRLCAVMEVTSVLLCTLSVALSQVIIEFDNVCRVAQECFRGRRNASSLYIIPCSRRRRLRQSS